VANLLDSCRLSCDERSLSDRHRRGPGKPAPGRWRGDSRYHHLQVLRLEHEALLRADRQHDGGGGADSFLWPATHLLRALMWGAMVDPTKYNGRLESYVAALSQYYQRGAGCYHNADGGCYGSSTGGGTPFFDDNALLDSALTDIYQRVYPNADMLNMAVTAFEYDMSARDEQWTVPQVTSQLGQGLLFSMATTPTGLSAERLLEITGDSNYAFIATTWYDIFTDINVKIMDQNKLLLNQGSFCWADAGPGRLRISTPGPGRSKNRATPRRTSPGFRAYQTSYVIELAVKLYTDTHNSAYLQEAQAIASSVLKTWYKPDAGSVRSPSGGNDSVDALMDLHGVDPDPKWFDAARDIVDFIINNGRDTSGYYRWRRTEPERGTPFEPERRHPRGQHDVPSGRGGFNPENRLVRAGRVCSGAASPDAGSTSDAGYAASDAAATDGSTDSGSTGDAGSLPRRNHFRCNRWGCRRGGFRGGYDQRGLIGRELVHDRVCVQHRGHEARANVWLFRPSRWPRGGRRSPPSRPGAAGVASSRRRLRYTFFIPSHRKAGRHERAFRS